MEMEFNVTMATIAIDGTNIDNTHQRSLERCVALVRCLYVKGIKDVREEGGYWRG